MTARIAFCFMILFLVALPAGAREIAGVDLAEQVTQEDGTQLQLNGAGIRSKFFFKIYLAAFYLETPHDAVAPLLEDNGGRRMLMHFLYDEVGRDDLLEAWNEGFSGNAAAGQLEELAAQISSFNALFDTVRSGDEIILDYQPEVGTAVIIRGEQKGVIEGKAFNDLLMRVWLGDKPVDKDLRQELLGS